MPVPNTIADLNQTAASNFPLGTDTVGPSLDDYLRAGFSFTRQIFDGTSNFLTAVSGTDTITATCPVPFTAYVAGQTFRFIAAGTSTVTAPTLNINGIGAKPLVQSNGTALWGGAVVTGTIYGVLYDGTSFRIVSGQLGAQVTGIQPNRIIDGNFNFWSKGTSFPLSAGAVSYVADVWIGACGTGGGATATVSRNGPFVVGQEPPGSATPTGYVLSFAQTVASTVTPSFVAQAIENVSTGQNRSMTLSMWLYTNSGTQTITSVSLVQNFGSGGSPSAALTTNTTVNWVLTTVPQKFSVRIDVPSISGKTLGTTAGTDFLRVQVNLPLNTTFTINTFQWKLEDCPAGAPATGIPTAFVVQPLNVERAAVERFYMQRTVSCRAFFSAGSQFADSTVSYAPMRAIPTAALITAGSRSNLSALTLIPRTSGATFEITSAVSGDSYALLDVWELDARF